MSIYVFVYGTLRAGEANDLAQAAARRGLPAPRLVGRAAVRGTLYDFGGWPGLLPDDRGPAVAGEVYAVPDSLLALMDEIEEVDPAGGSCFVRREVRVRVAPPEASASAGAGAGAGAGKCAAGVAPAEAADLVDCFYYPIDPAWAGKAVATTATDWIAYRRGRDAPPRRVGRPRSPGPA